MFKLERNSGCHLVVIVTTEWQPKREKIYKTDRNSAEMNCHQRNYLCGILFTTKNLSNLNNFPEAETHGFSRVSASAFVRWQANDNRIIKTTR